MTDDNMLSRIPGELLGSAGYALPAAESSPESTQRVTVRLPDGTRAEVVFIKLESKKGKTARWFWTPERATLIQMKAPPEQIKLCPIAQHDWQPAGVVWSGWPRESVQEMKCDKCKARRLLTDSDEDVQRMYGQR